MRSPSLPLEMDFVKLAPLTLSNYHVLSPIACQRKLVAILSFGYSVRRSIKKICGKAVEKEKSFAADAVYLFMTKKNGNLRR